MRGTIGLPAQIYGVEESGDAEKSGCRDEKEIQ